MRPTLSVVPAAFGPPEILVARLRFKRQCASSGVAYGNLVTSSIPNTSAEADDGAWQKHSLGTSKAHLSCSMMRSGMDGGYGGGALRGVRDEALACARSPGVDGLMVRFSKRYSIERRRLNFKCKC